MLLSEGIGHDLRELARHHPEVPLKLPARGGVSEDVYVIALDGHLLDLHSEPFSVVLIHGVKCGKRLWMPEPARECADVDFENDVDRIPRGKRTPSAPVPRLPQSSAVTQAAEFKVELLASHVTGTSRPLMGRGGASGGHAVRCGLVMGEGNCRPRGGRLGLASGLLRLYSPASLFIVISIA